MAHDRVELFSHEAERQARPLSDAAPQRDLIEPSRVDRRERRHYWAVVAEQLRAVRLGLTDRIDYDAVRLEAARRSRAEALSEASIGQDGK